MAIPGVLVPAWTAGRREVENRAAAERHELAKAERDEATRLDGFLREALVAFGLACDG
ncbi:hypothetical protein [Gephyromycinifex aptenodytis]|uniref:hypothetical protein n=1 Tax=Gephyromycinifex aptenodytis TaxID=2716227 RepID=UPI00144531E1|nr:hypothetical protein [Gephyromycinifex aptenodytis]